MLCRVTLRGCCSPPANPRSSRPRDGDLEVTLVEVRGDNAAGYKGHCLAEIVTTHEEVVPPVRRPWDHAAPRDATSETSTTSCDTSTRVDVQDGDLLNLGGDPGAGDAPLDGNLTTQCAVHSGNKCMGPDSLAMNEGSVEIDLSAEFPPERREAQEDFAQIKAAPSIFFKQDLPPQAAWWREVDPTCIGTLPPLTVASSLLEVRVVRHGPLTDGSLPWHSEQSKALYETMGMHDPTKQYTATWLNLGSVSLLLVSEALDTGALAAVFADDPAARLKFLLNPVQASVKFFPTKPPKDVPTIGHYFGHRSVSCTHAQTATGINCTVLQVDLHAKLFMRVLLQKLVFRRGNVVDILLVDWPTKALVAACCLSVTEEILQVLGHECGAKPEFGRP